MVWICSFQTFFLDIRREITEKVENEQKRLKMAEKSVSNCFRVVAALESWSNSPLLNYIWDSPCEWSLLKAFMLLEYFLQYLGIQIPFDLSNYHFNTGWENVIKTPNRCGAAKRIESYCNLFKSTAFKTPPNRKNWSKFCCESQFWILIKNISKTGSLLTEWQRNHSKMTSRLTPLPLFAWLNLWI